MSEYKTIDDYESFACEVKNTQRTFLSQESINFLNWLEEIIGKHDITMNEGDFLYRARKCVNKDKKLSKEEMKPKENMGVQGRANAININMLYLAGEKDIAISETRASLKEHVTLATFVVKRELKLVDFSGENPDYAWYFQIGLKSDPKTYHVQDLLLHIGNAFSKPLTIDEANTEYIPTQVIADYFKSKNYDGIAFRSQFTVKEKQDKYRNYALFDLDSAEAIGSELCFIEKISIDVETTQDYEKYT
jgi:hypothetical protein